MSGNEDGKGGEREEETKEKASQSDGEIVESDDSDNVPEDIKKVSEDKIDANQRIGEDEDSSEYIEAINAEYERTALLELGSKVVVPGHAAAKEYCGEIPITGDLMGVPSFSNVLKLSRDYDTPYQGALDLIIKKWTAAFPDEPRFSFKEMNPIHFIDSGSYGKVFRASFRGIDYAVKQFRTNNRRFTEMYKERDMLVYLKHRRIVSLFGAFCDSGIYLVMELCRESLHGIEQRLSKDHKLRFMYHILDAVAWIHSKGIIHCDIRKENFLIGSDNNLKLSDFGSSQLLPAGVEWLKLPHRVSVADYTDSLANMHHIYGKPSDVFAAACVIFELETTHYLIRYPFKAPALEYARVILEGRLVNARHWSPNVAAGVRKPLQDRVWETRGRFNAIVSRMIDADGSKRGTASEILASEDVKQVMLTLRDGILDNDPDEVTLNCKRNSAYLFTPQPDHISINMAMHNIYYDDLLYEQSGRVKHTKPTRPVRPKLPSSSISVVDVNEIIEVLKTRSWTVPSELCSSLARSKPSSEILDRVPVGQIEEDKVGGDCEVSIVYDASGPKMTGLKKDDVETSEIEIIKDVTVHELQKQTVKELNTSEICTQENETATLDDGDKVLSFGDNDDNERDKDVEEVVRSPTKTEGDCGTPLKSHGGKVIEKPELRSPDSVRRAQLATTRNLQNVFQFLKPNPVVVPKNKKGRLIILDDDGDDGGIGPTSFTKGGKGISKSVAPTLKKTASEGEPPKSSTSVPKKTFQLPGLSKAKKTAGQSSAVSVKPAANDSSGAGTSLKASQASEAHQSSTTAHSATAAQSSTTGKSSKLASSSKPGSTSKTVKRSSETQTKLGDRLSRKREGAPERPSRKRKLSESEDSDDSDLDREVAVDYFASQRRPYTKPKTQPPKPENQAKPSKTEKNTPKRQTSPETSRTTKLVDVFKCNYCSYSSPIVENVKSHQRICESRPLKKKDRRRK